MVLSRVVFALIASIVSAGRAPPAARSGESASASAPSRRLSRNTLIQRRGGASAAAALRHDPPVPGTPALEKDMPLKAAEQGFKGKDVQHVDKETMTSDWQKEFGPKGPQPATVEVPTTTPKPQKAGAPAVSCTSFGLIAMMVFLTGQQ
mmetsp:Transcript_54605/g.122840  ORF Transcript_54605/g.122840 Transcript_54605/m.122840 type:complete len:149 (-) Transcript_54605:80-526(-)